MVSDASPSSAERPPLTLPEEAARALRARYAEAGTILEYGSGGSTVLAAEMPGKRVFTVESDPAWAAMMERYFAAHRPASPVALHPVDIGPTKAWGRPADRSAAQNWHRYPLSVWERADFAHPDLILIDGRFRRACFLTALLMIDRPVTVLFDDYRRRKSYHRVEAFAQPVCHHGRMAEFRLCPAAPDRALARALVEAVSDPF